MSQMFTKATPAPPDPTPPPTMPDPFGPAANEAARRAAASTAGRSGLSSTILTTHGARGAAPSGAGTIAGNGAYSGRVTGGGN